MPIACHRVNTMPCLLRCIPLMQRDGDVRGATEPCNHRCLQPVGQVVSCAPRHQHRPYGGRHLGHESCVCCSIHGALLPTAPRSRGRRHSSSSGGLLFLLGRVLFSAAHSLLPLLLSLDRCLNNLGHWLLLLLAPPALLPLAATSASLRCAIAGVFLWWLNRGHEELV